MNALRILLTAAVAAFFVSAQASHHRLEPGTAIQATVPLCDTADIMRQVWDAHQTGGESMGAYVFRQYGLTANERGQPVCGMGRGLFVVQDTLESDWVTFSDGERKWGALVSLLARDGVVYYGLVVLDGPTQSGA